MASTTIAAPYGAPAGFRPQLDGGASPFAALVPTPARATSMSTAGTARATAFASASGTGAWPRLPRAAVATRLSALAADPTLIDQRGLNLCGPAAISYLLGHRDVDRLTDLMIALYDSGSATFGSLRVAGGSTLPTKDPATMSWGSAGRPELADWMLLSSLMDSMNSVMDFDGEPTDAVSAMSLPGDVQKWMEDGIGYVGGVSNEANKFFTKGLAHLRGLPVGLGRDIAMLINADPLTHTPAPRTCDPGLSADARPESGAAGDVAAAVATSLNEVLARSQGVIGAVGDWFTSKFPNHWIVPICPPVDRGTTITVRAWSWGGFHDFSASPATWDDNYYGAVIGRV